MDALLRDSAVTHRLKRALWLQNYERIRSIFETRVVKILTPPIFLCISTNPSRYNSSVPQIQDRTSEHLKHMYRDLYYVEHSSEEGHQKYPFLKRWLSDDTKQTYLTCIFDPKGSLARNYNTYVGMRASTLPPAPSAAQAGVQAILHHIQEVFCNGNQEHAAYVVRYVLIMLAWAALTVGVGQMAGQYCQVPLEKDRGAAAAVWGGGLWEEHDCGLFRQHGAGVASGLPDRLARGGCLWQVCSGDAPQAAVLLR